MQTPKNNRFVWSLAIQTLMHAPKFEEPTRFNLYFKNIFDSQYLFRSPVLWTKKIFFQLRSVLLVVYFYYISYTLLIFIHIQGHFHLNRIQNTYSVIVQRELLKVVNVSAFQSAIRKNNILNIQKTLKLLSNNAEWQNSQGL